jgi:hypothetical protein
MKPLTVSVVIVSMVGRLMNELERMWKEAVMAQFVIPFRHQPGWTEVNHKEQKSSVSIADFQTEIRSHSTYLFHYSYKGR